MTALSSGHLFYELRLLVEFFEISFTLIHACYLGNILVFSTVNPGLLRYVQVCTQMRKLRF